MARSVGLTDVRRFNRAAILRLIRRSGGISRSDIARQIGLTKPALSRISRELLDLGIVHEAPAPQPGSGRPPILLKLNASWAYAVTVSLSHSLSFGIVNLAGELTDAECPATETPGVRAYRDSFDTIVPDTTRQLLQRLDSQRVMGIGVVSGGRVDRRGIIRHNPELPRQDVDMRAVLARATDLPVRTDEEFRLLLLGHIWDKETPPWRNAVALGAGFSGLGGGQAVLVEGKLYYGHGGFAGLPGMYMGAVHGEEAVKQWKPRVQKMGGEAAYVRRVRDGDAEAVEIYEKCMQNYGYRIAQIANHFNPEGVLLYCPYDRIGQRFLDGVWPHVRQYADPLNLEGLEVRFGGTRSHQSRLVAAALPLLSRVFVDGQLDFPPQPPKGPDADAPHDDRGPWHE